MFAALADWDTFEVDILDIGDAGTSISSIMHLEGSRATTTLNEGNTKNSYSWDPSDLTSLDFQSPGPHCGPNKPPKYLDLGAILVHEVLGHAYAAALASPGPARALGTEQEAMFTENLYHSAASQATRCKY
jgi:hypothetical protein